MSGSVAIALSRTLLRSRSRCKISLNLKLLREIVPSIPSAVEQVVSKTLAKGPKERFASIRDFAETLERVSNSGDITSFVQPSPRIEPFSSFSTPASISGD